MKMCSKCLKEKNKTEFYIQRRGDKVYLRASCKSCMNDEHKLYANGIGKAIVAKVKRNHNSSDRAKAFRAKAVMRYRQTEKGKKLHRQNQRARYHKVTRGIVDYVLNRDKVCQLCGTENSLTLDHIQPISKGGTSVCKNLQVLCQRCNSFKKDRLLLANNNGIMLS